MLPHRVACPSQESATALAGFSTCLSFMHSDVMDSLRGEFTSWIEDRIQ
jgi:hypothetical protein